MTGKQGDAAETFFDLLVHLWGCAGGDRQSRPQWICKGGRRPNDGPEEMEKSKGKEEEYVINEEVARLLKLMAGCNRPLL